MASGHVNRIYRPNTWLHRPMLQNVKKALANSEPSTVVVLSLLSSSVVVDDDDGDDVMHASDGAHVERPGADLRRGGRLIVHVCLGRRRAEYPCEQRLHRASRLPVDEH